MKNTRSIPVKSTLRPRIPSGSLLCALLMCACMNPASHTAGPVPATSQITGNLKLSISPIATWITASTGSGALKGLTASRAMGIANSVKIQVQTAAGADVISPLTQNTYVTGPAMNGYPTPPIAVQLIPVGTNYTVKLSVYNNSVSATMPTVTGQASGVNVTQGANTTVSITCIPANPISITPSVVARTTSLAAQAEQWYSLQVASGTTYYFLQTTPNVAMGIFDNTGKLISSSSYIAYAATYTGTLNLGVVNNTGSSATAALMVSTTMPIMNEGSVASPVNLSLNQNHSFQIGPYNNQGTSYYSFTTDGSGTFVLNTSSGGYNAALYSDSGFANVVSISGNLNYGCQFAGLSAFTPYYLELTNNWGSFSSFTGQIMDPAAVAAAGTHDQGSVASPVSLTLGSAIAAQVGCHSYDMTSYYRFSTGSGVDYAISANNISPGSNVQFQVYSDAGFQNSIFNNSFNDASYSLPPLSPSTTYYVTASNGNGNSYPTTFSLEVSALPVPTFIALPTDGTWTPGNLSSLGNIAWYLATVTGGQSYTLNWDNMNQGSGSYTAWTYVGAYQSDRKTAYFTNMWQGFTTPQVINVPTGQTQVYVCVGNGPGTFALKMAEAASSGTVTVTAQ